MALFQRMYRFYHVFDCLVYWFMIVYSDYIFHIVQLWLVLPFNSLCVGLPGLFLCWYKYDFCWIHVLKNLILLVVL